MHTQQLRAFLCLIILSGTVGALAVEWFRPESGETSKGQAVQGGAAIRFQMPFQAKDAVLYLHSLEE
jgi:hypothetical protein